MKRKTFKKLLFAFIPCILLSSLFLPIYAQLSAAQLFSDNMVLQRQQPIRIWGQARPKARFLVRLNRRSEEVAEPRYLRYAWADKPADVKLFNEEGLPVVPFRIVRE